MAKKGFNFLILIALVLGGLSIYLFKVLLNAEVEKARGAIPPVVEKVETQKVLVAKDDIPMGKTVGSLDVDVLDYPVKLVPPGALTTVEQLSGKFTANLIPKGDVISDKKIVVPSQLPRASMIVERGRRLLSIRVDEIKANGYMVKNGDYVDLMGTFAIPDGLVKGGDFNSRTLTVTFLQKVKIFDIIYGNEVGNSGQGDKGGGQRPDGGSDKRLARGTTATFDVTTKEAELIMSADGQAQGGGLMLVLRRPDDDVIDPPPSDLHKQIIATLQGETTRKKVEEPPPVVPAAPARKKIL